MELIETPLVLTEVKKYKKAVVAKHCHCLISNPIGLIMISRCCYYRQTILNMQLTIFVIWSKDGFVEGI